MVHTVASDGDRPIGILARCLGGIAGFGARSPRLCLWLMVLIGCAGVGATYSELKLQTSRSDLLAPADAWTDYEAFGGESELVVVVENKTPDAVLIQNVLDTLADRLERDSEHFANVLCKFDQSALQAKALQYLSPAELESAIRRVDQYGPVLAHQQWDLLKVDRLARSLDKNIQVAATEQKDPAKAYDYANKLATSLNDFVKIDGQDVQINSQGFVSPWPEIVSTEVEHAAQQAAGNRNLSYLMNSDRRVGMLHVQAVATDSDSELISETIPLLREHLAAVKESLDGSAPDLQLSITGIPALEYDELQRSQRDTFNAALIAFVAVGLLLSFGLRGVRHPTLVLLMLVNALAITFGIAALTVGHINILSICFTAIVIGLGVDFGIHFVTRYLFLRQELYEMDESLVLAGQSVGPGILTSASTTAIAFGSAALTGFPGLAELGVITAGGILVCAFLTFTFLPALIALSDEKVEVDELPVPISGDFWRSAVAGYPLSAICVAGIAILAVAYNAVTYSDGTVTFKVDYDSNLLHMQDATLASVQAERTLAEADDSLLYAVAIAHSLEETDALREQLLALPTVARVSDISSRIPEPPSDEQKRLIAELKSKLSKVPRNTPQFDASDYEVVGRSLDQLYKTLEASNDVTAHDAAVQLDSFLNNFVKLDASQQTAVTEAYQNLMVGALLKEFGQVSRATSLDPIVLTDLPEAWRNRHMMVEGDKESYLLKIYPREDVWNEAALAGFVGDVRSVAPQATGTPIQYYDASVKMKECYQAIAVYSLVAIALFLLFDFLRPGQKLLTMLSPMLVVGFIGYTAIQRQNELNVNLLVGIYVGMVAFIAMVFDFRNLRDTFIAMIPPLGGGLMLLGLMAVLNVDFNPLNLVALPLVLGIGVDDGVHMVHDYRRQLMSGSKKYTPSGDTVNGVLLTSLTSIIGFGSLMISAHMGLKTVGIVLALGIASCLAVALLLVPPILVLVAKHQPASFEPVIVRKPRKKAEEASDDSSDEGSNDNSGNGNNEGRRLSRKERRRQQQAA